MAEMSENLFQLFGKESNQSYPNSLIYSNLWVWKAKI